MVRRRPAVIRSLCYSLLRFLRRRPLTGWFTGLVVPVVLAGGISAWKEGGVVARIPFIHDVLAKDGSVQDVVTLFRSAGITATVLGCIGFVGLWITGALGVKSMPHGQRWILGILGSACLGVGLALWLQGEQLGGVGFIRDMFPKEASRSDVRMFLPMLGRALTIFAAFEFFFLGVVARPRRYGIRWGLAFGSPIKAVLIALVVLYLGLAGFHWSK